MKSVQNLNRKKVFIFSPFNSPFIEVDKKILAEFALVTHVVSSKIKAVLKIFKGVLSNDIIYCWFGSIYAGYAALLSKLISKKSIIVIGGVDAVAVPQFNYGIWLNPWKAFFLKKTLPLADFILVVAPNLKENLKKFISYSGENIFYLPTGYNFEYWKPKGDKEDFILSVGACDSINYWRKKFCY